MIFKEIDSMKDVGAICHYYGYLCIKKSNLLAEVVYC